MQFKLPELGEGVHEGELIKWRVKPGDQVVFDQPLLEIMTDKATVEIPSAFKGKVDQLHAKEGDTVHVDQLMITFEGPIAAPSPQVSAAAPSPSPSSTQPSSLVATTVIANRVPAAPSTRKYAREQGVDLAKVQPSGPSGRVMREDIEKFIGGTGAVSAGTPQMAKSRAAFPGANPGPASSGDLEERVPFRGLRKKIAEKMRQSKDHAAHFTYVEEADATELVKLRAQAKDIGAKQGIKVTYLPFVMKAMVACLKRYPILNSSLDEAANELVYKHYFNIGLSVQTEDGLTAPVIKGVEHKSVLEIAKEIQEVVERARLKKLTMDDLTGSTITLTNAGSIGGLFATPVINYPEVAILGFNKIFRRPSVVLRDGPNGKQEGIEIRDWTYFSISLDHRVVDGAIGAEFMNQFVQYIENPALMILS